MKNTINAASAAFDLPSFKAFLETADRGPIKNRYDFVIIFDCKYGNPNGDPDSGNLPRIDPQTGKGLVTDVCLKRKIRNEVARLMENEPGFKMYIQPGDTLNNRDEEAYLSVGADEKSIVEYRKGHPEVDDLLRKFMCENYFDIRTFGGVMTKFSKANISCASIRGPVQMSMAVSASPIDVQNLSVSRVAVATQAERDSHENTFGQKPIISYGLYTCHGSICAMQAEKYTGFSERDLEVFWKAIENIFLHDKAAIRTDMVMRKLIIFKHNSAYGNAHPHKLVERVHIEEVNPDEPIQGYSDYRITVDTDDLPSGITVEIRD